VELALAMADASVDDVTHINAHATSTPVGDPNEYTALKAVFGDRIDDIPVSATKASTGHLLGGTGALEAIFTILAISERQAPPTINITEQDPAVPFRVSGSVQSLGAGDQLAISNSFGFGGHNAVVAFSNV
jgi:3-oxoacyl-[acyl-carrier-protein] synthase II